MAEKETQAEQSFAWDSFFSGATDIAIAGLGVMEAKAKSEPAPPPSRVTVSAVPEATPKSANVGQNNNGTTVVQPTTSIMGSIENNKMLLIGGGVAVGALVLVLALRK